MKLLIRLGHIFDYALAGGMWLASSLLAFAMLLICASVVSRYFLHKPLPWVLEICEYCLLAICFMAAAWLLKNGGQITIKFVLVRLKPKTQAMVSTIAYSLATIVYLVLTVFGGLCTWDNYLRDTVIRKMLYTPKFILLAVITAGCLLLFIQLLRMTYGYMRSWRLLRGKE